MINKTIQLNELAADVIKLSRNQLLVNLRFMDAALSRLEPMPLKGVPIATEGHFLVYDPVEVLKRYKRDRAEPVRDYLHVVLHCIYRHMFVHTLVDHELWDLACDIAIEYSISTLNLRTAEAGRQAKQMPVFADLQQKAGMLTAEKLYRYFLDHRPSDAKRKELQGLFGADDHTLWYLTVVELRAMGIGEGNGSGDGDGEGKGDSQSGDGSGGAPAPGSEEDWKDVSEHMQMDMETFSKRQGTQAGGMMQNLREVNREKYDYSEFLRRFAVMGEVMKVNDDEFDYIFYTYGLQLFENMPLIEPLEYKEVKRIREFVIAIDTSGSVMGETVQTFIQKTYNVLKSTESFFSKINLHIIQCDAEIQEHVKITSQDEFDAYLKTMTIKGLGGTDFRPVFDFVDELVENREFQNLKGLIYFTDGYGTFPARMPDYTTAFVFIDDEYNNPEVPPWAIKVVLQKGDL